MSVFRTLQETITICEQRASCIISAEPNYIFSCRLLFHHKKRYMGCYHEKQLLHNHKGPHIRTARADVACTLSFTADSSFKLPTTDRKAPQKKRNKNVAAFEPFGAQLGPVPKGRSDLRTRSYQIRRGSGRYSRVAATLQQ